MAASDQHEYIAKAAAKGTGAVVPVTITRPANATAYTALDVVGGAFEIPLIGPAKGVVEITDVFLRIDVAAVPAGMAAFRLHLYNVTPPSAIADNAAWDIAAGDRASYLGYVDITVPVDIGSTLFVQVSGLTKKFKLLTTSLFGYLQTIAGYTPAGNSEVYVVSVAGKGA